MITGVHAVRIAAATVAAAVVVYLGIAVFGSFDTEAAAVASWASLAAVALLAAFVAYGAVELLQTGRVESVSRQFGTRTLVLMPLAIALNIVLGAAVGNALKIPIYLDSIGTILVGALAGPIPGALTGLLSNVLWAYAVPPPIQNVPAGAFAIVAAVIGLLAGVAGRLTLLRPRPGRPLGQLLAAGLVAIGLVILLGVYAYSRFYTDAFELFTPGANPAFVVLGWLVVAIAITAVAGLLILLVVRRDMTVAFVAVAGVLTGVIAALISAPISANLFSGVTGAGTDFLVAAFRQAGSDIQTATFQQGLLSDPVDKLVTFFVVYVVVQAMSRRVLARFPQGELLMADASSPGERA